MIKKILLGAFLGGIVAHVWGVISWMALPWHNWQLKKVSNEAVLRTAVQATVPENGIYILPNIHDLEGLSPEEQEGARKEGMEQMQQGVFMFASIRLNGARPMGPAVVFTLLQNILAAGLVTWLLLRTNIKTFFARVAFVKIVALFGIVTCLIPTWVWWGFSTGYTIVESLDRMIAWGLAGVVIAKIASPTNDPSAAEST